jgi:membrane-associated phospholipid phosphatase
MMRLLEFSMTPTTENKAGNTPAHDVFVLIPGLSLKPVNPFVLRAAFCVFCTTFVVETRAESSPFDFSWPRETALLSTGLAGHFIGQYRLSRMSPARPEELRRADLFPVDRWNAGRWHPPSDLASDWLARGVGGAMIYADIWHGARGVTSWQPLLEDVLILSQAFAWSSAINLNVRTTRVHPRPFVYGDAAPASLRTKGEAAGGFYSDHAASAFLGAVYVSTVYPLRRPDFEHRGWLWAGTLTAATGVAVLRVTAGKHFPSDVLAGAAMGSLIGLGFVQLHLKDRAGLWGWRAAPWLAPDGGAGVVAMRWL